MLYCTIYLYRSFNYPALSAFDAWSISFYLMPGEASTCIPTFCAVVRALALTQEATILFCFVFFSEIFFCFYSIFLPWMNELFHDLNLLKKGHEFCRCARFRSQAWAWKKAWHRHSFLALDTVWPTCINFGGFMHHLQNKEELEPASLIPCFWYLFWYLLKYAHRGILI